MGQLGRMTLFMIRVIDGIVSCEINKWIGLSITMFTAPSSCQWIAKPGTENAFHDLRESMSRDPVLQAVYDSDRVIIFRVTLRP